MKYYYAIIGILLIILALAWAFNHIDPWISIGSTIVLIGFLIPLFNHFKNKLDK